MSEQADFFFNTKSSVIELELIEISHPSFSKVYRIVRNAVGGVTVTLPDLGPTRFDYYPLKITDKGNRDDLDAGLTIDLGDLGSVLPMELDRVAADNSFSIKPLVRYWTYRSDDLTAPMSGPTRFQLPTMAFNRDGCSMDVKAPALNLTGTGEVYTYDRFPMLRGFL